MNIFYIFNFNRCHIIELCKKCKIGESCQLFGKEAVPQIC